MERLIQNLDATVHNLDTESNCLRAEGSTGDARALRQAAGLVSAARWLLKGVHEARTSCFVRAQRNALAWAQDIQAENERV